jgi:hypothetical protein
MAMGDSGSECHKHREEWHAPSHQFTSFGVPCPESWPAIGIEPKQKRVQIEVTNDLIFDIYIYTNIHI